MGPRYQCLSLGSLWTWRLLGSNHRELARAWGTFSTREEAAADAVAVGRAARTAQMEISVSVDTSWRWVLVVDGVPRAASSVHYGRRLECLRAVARFRDCAPVATVLSTPVIRRRPARGSPARGQSRGDLRPDPSPQFATGLPATGLPATGLPATGEALADARADAVDLESLVDRPARPPVPH